MTMHDKPNYFQTFEKIKNIQFNNILNTNYLINQTIRDFSSSFPILKKDAKPKTSPKKSKKELKKKKLLKQKKEAKKKLLKAATDENGAVSPNPIPKVFRREKFSKRQIFPVVSAMKRKELIRKAESLGFIIIKEKKQPREGKPDKGKKFLKVQKKKKENTKKLLTKAAKEIKTLHDKERKKRNVTKKRRGWEIYVPPAGLATASHRRRKDNLSWIKRRRQFGP
eukprot:TRINITY_DN3390_c0_g1_i1.p1 TRINITY_DN3390_c0_g1~~TRINITY_DN3390_c0_g1_i1.p1  ORF type:complete len:243 (-),score=85.40 TRINITY_DN3390_c0_g1_i1:48-719(-)